MRRQLLLAEFRRQVWALPLDVYQTYTAVLERWASFEPASAEVMVKVAADTEARDAKRAAAVAAGGGGIQVIPVYGALTQRANMDVSGPGTTSTMAIATQVREALADDAVGQILLDIDSPGGSVYGVSELGDVIMDARAKKPVIGIANSLCASAAYWLGSQCNELYITPGGEAGSIGVICAHEDQSKFDESVGVKVTYITAGRYKSEGNAHEPLSAECLAYEQSRVNEYYSAFTKAVSKGRGVPLADVRDKMGEGRVMGAQAAVAAKMCDGVMTFEEVIKRMRSQAKQPPTKTGKSPETLRAERERQILISSQS